MGKDGLLFNSDDMADYISTDPNAGLEEQKQYLSTDPSFGIEQAPTIGEIAQHAGTAAVETAKEFVPKSLGEILGFATGSLVPAVGAVEDVGRGYGMLKDVLFGKPINQATAESFPETQIIPEAEKTAPYSEERFKAGFGTLAQMGMAALVGKGLARPQIPETPISDAASIKPKPEEVIPSATKEGIVEESSIAEHPRDGESGPSTEASSSSGVEPVAEIKGTQEVVPIRAYDRLMDEKGNVFGVEDIPRGTTHGGGYVIRDLLQKGARTRTVTEEQVARMHRVPNDIVFGPDYVPTPPVPEGDVGLQPLIPKEETTAVPQPEPFPSILQSAEEQRRVERQPAPEVEPQPIGKNIEQSIPGFPEEGKQIGLTKDYISEDRQARGEEPLAKQARQTNPETWDMAGDVMARNPNAGHELVASIINNPRTLNPDEVGVLLRHRVNLSNQADLEFKRMTSGKSTPSEKGDALIRMQTLTDARNQADTANDMIGTQIGRSFQFLQQLSAQDFSLSGINQQRLAAMGGKELSGPELEAFTKENAKWSEDLLKSDQELQNYQREQSKKESALKGYKTRLKSATTEYERRLAFSDYSPEIRKELEGDPELARLKADRDTVRSKFQDQLVKDQLANRPMWQKILGGISWASRESALSGYHTLVKLAGFTGGKLAEIPLTQTAERVWGMIPGFKDIAAKSEFGPGANAKALGKFYSEFFTTGMKQAAQQLKTGTSDFKAQYGDETIPMNYPSFFGNLHGAEKTPLRVGVAGMTRERMVNKSMNDLAAQAVSEGHDITDPLIQAAINKKAFDAGTNEILMGNNLFAEKVNGLFRSMEAPQKATGEPSAVLSVMSTLAKSLITKGIVRTPANFVKQVFERTPAGLGLGVARGVRAIAKGVENVPVGERTAIMRLLGVGSVGSGMFLWGVADALRPPEKRMFGGYYQPGEKRGNDDVKWGSVRIGDTTAPHYLTHNLLSEPAQMGNTLMRVALSSLSKKDRTNKGLVAGIVASTLGLAEQAPIANPAVRLQKLTDPRQQSNYFGEIVRGLIPQFVQNIAEDTDRSEKGRKAKGVTETVKLGIPGLRQTVPEKSTSRGNR